jgi:cytochrome c2
MAAGTVAVLRANRAPSSWVERGRRALGVACLVVAGCDISSPAEPPDAPAGADAARGQQLLSHYQCGSCHIIPEVPAAAGRIGPSLERFGLRSYIAGRVPNDSQNLATWIESPQSLVPDTRMPDMGAPAADARDMAAYLGGLR